MKELRQVRDAVICALRAGGLAAEAAFPEKWAAAQTAPLATVAVGTAEGRALVALDLGPIGQLLEPTGTLDFEAAVEKDVCGRAASVAEEIAFVRAHKEFAATLVDMQESGELPLRVTHNDTKLNNVLFDEKTGKPLAVVDLDTVMPGLAVNDFGDSIRFGANTAAEDETDLDKVECDMELFELYTKGFVEGCAGSLTAKELEMLPMGAKVMTFECGIRFLADYLEGDVYFKIHREGHNLDRCRTQFKLVEDMEKKWDIMNEIVRKYS